MAQHKFIQFAILLPTLNFIEAQYRYGEPVVVYSS